MSYKRKKPKDLEGIPDISIACDMCQNFDQIDGDCFPCTNIPRCRYLCGDDCVTVLNNNIWRMYCKRYKGQEVITI